MYREIDLENWERKDLFLFFQTFDDPSWDILADVRITAFYDIVKRAEHSFFLSFIYVAAKACNTINAFRQRITDEGKVIEYELVHPGSTVLYENGTFGFGYFNFQHDMDLFLKEAQIEFNSQKQLQNLDPKDEDLARIYFSPIPWITFRGFRHPFNSKANRSIPRIVFGKHYEREGERWIPVGLSLHHGLADGYHAGLFFQKLQDLLDQPADYVNSPLPA